MHPIGHYIWVYGNPVPKQSTRFDGHGHAHTDPRIKAWQDTIRVTVRSEYQDAPIIGDVSVTLTFALQDRKRRDLDNLSKAVLDALNGLVWVDDTQVVKLSLTKLINKSNPGVGIMFVPVEIVL